MIRQPIRLSATVLAGSLGLAACGGGGGSAGVPGLPVPPDSSLLSLDAGNYQAVGRATVSSAFYLGDTGSSVSGTGPGGGALLLRRAAESARRVALEVRDQPAASPALALRQTLNCRQGGTLVLSISDANNNGQVDVGDTLTLDAQSCKEDDSVLQGRIGLSMKALTGVFDSNSYGATLAMTLTAFSISHGGDTVQGDGALDLSLSQTPTGATDLSLSTTRLVLSGKLGGQPFSTTLNDAKLSLHIEPQQSGGRKSSFDYSSGLSIAGLGDRQVMVTTRLPLEAGGSDAYPSSGQLMVKGRDNSTLRITPVSATQARLELDAQGDGVYETQVLKTWTELR